MELELYNTRLKYEDGVLWRWYRGVRWKEVKITPNKLGYSNINLDGVMRLYHRVVYKVCNPEWDITDSSSDNQVDHICGVKPLDNRIENLRILNSQQNKCNNLHFVKGYYYVGRLNKYQAQLTINRKSVALGLHDTPEQAREAYLKAKLTYHQM
tara:strand:- start:78 stop:539 length:462 start_codon:yes stop_codon:yes gene_type:complete